MVPSNGWAFSDFESEAEREERESTLQGQAEVPVSRWVEWQDQVAEDLASMDTRDADHPAYMFSKF